MGRKGLEDTVILREAALLISENGFKNFSLRGLARRMKIQSASLYNHFESMEALLTRVAWYVMEEMNQSLYRAIADKTRDEAVAALFYAYRDYVLTNPEIYRVVLSLPQSESGTVEQAASTITKPVEYVLKGYDITKDQALHSQRYMRSLMHGFATLEGQGYLVHLKPKAEESYHFIIRCVIKQLHDLEEGGKLR